MMVSILFVHAQGRKSCKSQSRELWVVLMVLCVREMVSKWDSIDHRPETNLPGKIKRRLNEVARAVVI